MCKYIVNSQQLYNIVHPTCEDKVGALDSPWKVKTRPNHPVSILLKGQMERKKMEKESNGMRQEDNKECKRGREGGASAPGFNGG